jgi:acyl carrier protein
MSDDIFQRITKVVANQLSIDPSEVVPEALIQDDLGADSLDLVELIIDLEDEFDIKIDDESSKVIKTVQDAVDFISSKL